MPDSGFYNLLAVPSREEKATCGCVLVLVQERSIDAREGHFIAMPTLVVVPCDEGVDHVEQMRQVIEGMALGDEDLDEMIRRFEEEIA